MLSYRKLIFCNHFFPGPTLPSKEAILRMILDWRRSFVPHFKDEIVCLKKQPIYAESFTFSGQILALNLSTYKQNYYVVKKSFLVSFSCP